MKKYEELISDYLAKNADTLTGKAPSKKRLIKFSEAISRAILERKKSDAGYGDLAESLAAAGLSDSGYASYLSERNKNRGIAEIKSAADEKLHAEAVDTHEEELEAERLLAERLEEEEKEKLKLEEEEKKKLEAEAKEKEKLEKEEKERLEKEEKEKIAAEKKEAERLEKEAKERDKNKKTVLSFAEANKVTDAGILYTYALSLGLPESDAREISETAASSVKEKLRLANIEKVREHIVLQRFTKLQAYDYAIHLGLDEKDAHELADFAYRLNQYTGQSEAVSGGAQGKIPPKSEITSPHLNKK